MTPRIYISRDAGALALDAEGVERAIVAAEKKRGLTIEIVRTGSRGLFWLEPMIEVATPAGRIAYGPVQASDVETLFDAGFLDGGSHPLRIGHPENIPFLKRQTRLTFARCGVIDRLSAPDYFAHGGFRGIERAIASGPAAIIDAAMRSGMPKAIQWRAFAQASAARKYIVCNAHDGDSGVFADRMLMEGDPLALIEGMAIAGVATGATKAYIYLRSSYRHAGEMLDRAIVIARREKLLGAKILGSPYDFDLEIRVGAGADVAGDETALLDSLAGKCRDATTATTRRTHAELFEQPAIVDDVISLATMPLILAGSADTCRDRRTVPIQLSGNVKNRGLFETASRPTLGELVEDIGGGTATGRSALGVRIGGPRGIYFPRALFDMRFDEETLAAKNIRIGHRTVVVFDDNFDSARLLKKTPLPHSEEAL